MATRRRRLIIADDHTILMDGLRHMLESEFDIAGTVGDGRALLDIAADVKPDIVLLDIELPLLNGFEAARELKSISPESKVIFLTVHADAGYVAEAFRVGGAGYLPKRSARTELVAAIHNVLAGGKYVSPLLTDKTQPEPLLPRMPRGRISGELTPRQSEILILVAEGCSRKEVAKLLNISVKTVEFHKAALANGFGLRRTADFTRYAIEHGFISIERNDTEALA